MGQLLDQPWWVLALAGLLSVIGTARATRLVTSDNWPPIASLRQRWKEWTEATVPAEGAPPTLGGTPQQRLTWRYAWQDLFTCPFCFAPYVTAVSLGWALWCGLDVQTFWGATWWLGHLWFTIAYLAAMLVVRDEPPEEG